MALTRRRLLEGLVLVPAAVWLAACGGDEEDAGGTTTTDRALAPTPACGDDHEPTVEQTEGPYYTPDTPERRNLRGGGVSGEALLLTGTVLGTDCKPVAKALLDFWQADGDGEYDNEGFRLRGHQFTDSRGRFRLETVVPGLYPGRTRHIHVKVQRPNGEPLTTQLYFPGEAQNGSDGIFDEALLLNVRGSRATFDFVLA